MISLCVSQEELEIYNFTNNTQKTSDTTTFLAASNKLKKVPKTEISMTTPTISSSEPTEITGTTVVISPTRKGASIAITEARYDSYLMNAFLMFLMTFQDRYPLRILGKTKNKLTKEALETTSAWVYLKNAFEQIFFPDASYSQRPTEFEKYFGNEKTVCIVPGDGIGPRTGLMFALLTKWQVISVDPIMNIGALPELPSNLTCIKGKVEDIDLKPYQGFNCVSVHVHSHANYEELWKKFEEISPNAFHIGYSNPCCVGYQHTLDNHEESGTTLWTKAQPRGLKQLTPKCEVYVYVRNNDQFLH